MRAELTAVGPALVPNREGAAPRRRPLGPAQHSATYRASWISGSSRFSAVIVE